VACGVKGVVVSNHGGRQMDGSPPAIEILPEIVAAVGDKVCICISCPLISTSDEGCFAIELLLGLLMVTLNTCVFRSASKH
jgi:hypothetical protein